jgi:hypothetical protein
MSRKGIPNKSSMRAELTCQVRKFSSIDAMIDAAEIALQKFVEEESSVKSGRLSPMESNACEYLKIYVAIAKEIASYVHAKRKAIEHIQVDPLKDMSPEQKLEAMKQAVALLEHQVKTNEARPPNP